MIFSCNLKSGFLPTVTTLIMTLQLAGCGTEEFLSEIAPSIGTEPSSEVVSSNSARITGTDTGSVIEDIDPDGDNMLEVSGQLNIIDNDNNENSFIAETISGTYGSLVIDSAGSWTYSADNRNSSIQNLDSGSELRENLTISSFDGTTHTIEITIFGVVDSGNNVNTPAVITGTASASVYEDVDPDNDNVLEASGRLYISDVDAGEAAFIATTFNGSYGNLTINSTGYWAYAANNRRSAIQNLNSNSTLTDSITVSSLDGTTRSIVITIVGADEAPVTADINLSWVAPSLREDSTSISLSEIASYRIFYGTTQGQYTSTVNINNSTATGYTFSNLSPGTYYFVVTTIDTSGRESQFSSVVSKSI